MDKVLIFGALFFITTSVVILGLFAKRSYGTRRVGWYWLILIYYLITVVFSYSIKGLQPCLMNCNLPDLSQSEQIYRFFKVVVLLNFPCSIFALYMMYESYTNRHKRKKTGNEVPGN